VPASPSPRRAHRRNVILAFALAIVCYWLLESAYVSLRLSGGLAATLRHLVPPDGVELLHRIAVVALLVTVAVWTHRLQSRSTAARRELHEATARLADSERSVQLATKVFEHALEGIVVTDPDGTIQMVNPSFTAITGYTAAEAIGNNPRMLKSDRHDDAFYETMWRSLAEEGSWSGQIWNRNKRGEAYPEWLNINAVRDADGAVSNYVAVFHDMSDIERSRARMQHLAYHDPLTGLPNRSLLDDRLRIALAQARRARSMVAVIFVDLDDFKRINDSFGHPAGDLALQQVARRLEACVREEDTVSRRGGDEFVVVLSQIRSPVAAMRVGQAILRTLSNPLAVGGRSVRIGATLGAAVYPVDGTTPEDLLRNADLALYRAKERGKGVFQPFTREISRQVTERVRLEGELRDAVGREDITVDYQPIMDASGTGLVAVEALARWRRATGAVVTAERFVTLAEDTGLVVPIGREMLRAAGRDLARWRRDLGADIGLAFNLSAPEIVDEGLVEAVGALVADSGAEPGALMCEIGEDVIADLDEAARDALRRLAGLGVRIVVDGYRGETAPPAVLVGLPLDGVKLARTVVDRIGDGRTGRDGERFVSGLTSMARCLDLSVAAAGVRSTAQLEFLRRHGVERVQGFLFGRPTTAAAVDRWLTRGFRSSGDGAQPPAAGTADG